MVNSQRWLTASIVVAIVGVSCVPVALCEGTGGGGDWRSVVKDVREHIKEEGFADKQIAAFKESPGDETKCAAAIAACSLKAQDLYRTISTTNAAPSVTKQFNQYCSAGLEIAGKMRLLHPKLGGAMAIHIGVLEYIGPSRPARAARWMYLGIVSGSAGKKGLKNLRTSYRSMVLNPLKVGRTVTPELRGEYLFPLDAEKVSEQDVGSWKAMAAALEDKTLNQILGSDDPLLQYGCEVLYANMRALIEEGAVNRHVSTHRQAEQDKLRRLAEAEAARREYLYKEAIAALGTLETAPNPTSEIESTLARLARFGKELRKNKIERVPNYERIQHLHPDKEAEAKVVDIFYNYIVLGDLKKTAKLLDAMGNETRDTRVWVLRIDAAVRQEDWTAASRNVEKLLAIDPDHAKGRMMKIRLEEMKKQREKRERAGADGKSK